MRLLKGYKNKREANQPLSSTEVTASALNNYVDDMSHCIADEADNFKLRRKIDNFSRQLKNKKMYVNKSDESSSAVNNYTAMSCSMATGTMTTRTRSSSNATNATQSHATPTISNVTLKNGLNLIHRNDFSTMNKKNDEDLVNAAHKHDKPEGYESSYHHGNVDIEEQQQAIDRDEVNCKAMQLQEKRDQLQGDLRVVGLENKQSPSNFQSTLSNSSVSSSFGALTDVSSLTFHSHRSITRRQRQRQLENTVSHSSKRGNALADSLVDEEYDGYSSLSGQLKDKNASDFVAQGLLQCEGKNSDIRPEISSESNKKLLDVFQGCFPVINIQQQAIGGYKEECHMHSCIDESSLSRNEIQVTNEEQALAEEMTSSLQSIKASSDELMIQPSNINCNSIDVEAAVKGALNGKITLLVWPKMKATITGAGGFGNYIDSSNIVTKERLSSETGIFLSESTNGVAWVKKVKNSSHADEAGICRGDIVQVSFSLWLLNTFFFIKRLSSHK